MLILLIEKGFSAMARKGFVSFDRTNIANLEDNRYHCVCKPRSLELKPQGLNLFSVNTEYNLNIADVQELEDLMRLY